MKVAVFSTKSYDREFLDAANQTGEFEFVFFEARLTTQTAALAADFPAICCFINDCLDAAVLGILARGKTQFIALRSAGYDRVDLHAAAALGLTVVRVPAYSPHAVAEHAAGLILTLNRKLHRAYNRVRDDNFSLSGLLGFDLHGSTVGIVGTGKIGCCFARIMHGFGCKLLAYDLYPNEECLALGVAYVELPELLAAADIVSLHCPLTESTYHLLDRDSFEHLKPGAMLINTSRGALIDADAAIAAIKSGRLGYLGLDVYESEADIFFEDLSDTVIQDDTIQLLQSFPNTVITAHQAFFTRNALEAIATTTLANLRACKAGEPCANRVLASAPS